MVGGTSKISYFNFNYFLMYNYKYNEYSNYTTSIDFYRLHLRHLCSMLLDATITGGDHWQPSTAVAEREGRRGTNTNCFDDPRPPDKQPSSVALSVLSLLLAGGRERY